MNKMRFLRLAVGAAVLLVPLVALAANGAVGTLCALCPVGFAQVSLASGSVPWHLLPGVLVVLASVFMVGRAFCAWLCPTGFLRNAFGGRTPRGLTGQVGSCAGCGRSPANPNQERTHSNLASQGIVLAVLLVVSFFVHFPVFCLICPIGLAFGTLFAVSRLFFTWQPGLELIVFPAMLLAEIFLLRRWCSAICPLGFFFGALSKLRTRLGFLPAPRANRTACIHNEGCNVCTTVCPEDICVATATAHDLEDCTFCLNCRPSCPTKAIALTGETKDTSSPAQKAETE